MNEISFILHGGEKQAIHDPHREPTYLCNWGKEAWKKKVKALPVFEPVTSANTGALLYQLSYEATHWEPGHSWKFLFKSQFALALSLL